MGVLFINACVRENSRTLVLAENVIKSSFDGDITEINLNAEGISPLDREALENREALIKEGKKDDPALRYAVQFAEADEIVIAAPFWDLSFPALLKIYFERITVAGITFEYRDGRPTGLCKAKRLRYVTTSGGPIISDFGYSYVKELANRFYGIMDTEAIRAENLDVFGVPADRVLADAEITVIK